MSRPPDAFATFRLRHSSTVDRPGEAPPHGADDLSFLNRVVAETWRYEEDGEGVAEDEELLERERDASRFNGRGHTILLMRCV